MPQTIKFYTDEGVHNAIIQGLRLHGVDVVSAPEAGMLGKDDQEHLDFAKQEGRVLFVRDVDYLALANTVLDHAGIVYANQDRKIGACIRTMLTLWNTLEPKEMIGRVVYV